jgi:hypothetical protein
MQYYKHKLSGRWHKIPKPKDCPATRTTENLTSNEPSKGWCPYCFTLERMRLHTDYKNRSR